MDSTVSTRAPSPGAAAIGNEKEFDRSTAPTPRPLSPARESVKKEEDAGSTDMEGAAVAAPLAEGEYPEGIQLVFIVVALVLSIFLVSLDMVRCRCLSKTRVLMLTEQDNRRYCDSQDHRRVSRLRQGLLVRLGLFHVCRRLPVNL
jgi:hypothetical protein